MILAEPVTAIVGQMAVPILPDDTAAEVFSKVLVAAEMVLDKTLPAIVNGTVQRQEMDLTQGSYFGGRKPGDGVIYWKRMALFSRYLAIAVLTGIVLTRVIFT